MLTNETTVIAETGDSTWKHSVFKLSAIDFMVKEGLIEGFYLPSGKSPAAPILQNTAFNSFLDFSTVFNLVLDMFSLTYTILVYPTFVWQEE